MPLARCPRPVLYTAQQLPLPESDAMTYPDPQGDRLQEARDLLAQGERDQALAVLYSLVTVMPGHRDAWWLIAQHTPQPRQRQEALQTVLTLDPNFAPALVLQARLNAPEQPGAFPQTEAPGPQPPPVVDAPPVYRDPAPYSAPPPAPDYISHPDRVIAPPAYTPEPEPEPEPPEPRKRHDDRLRGSLQPWLVFNGGCSSGCFSGVLTAITLLVLAFLLIGNAVTLALRQVGALDPGQSATFNLAPAIAITAALAFLRANPISLPFNLGNLVGGAASSEAVFSDAMQSLWTSMGYPVQTGDVIIQRLSLVRPQVSAAGWVPLIVFLVGWIALAFFFVFLRARSMRVLHWFLSTIGLWLMTALAAGVGVLLFRLINGGV
jgi:hypothetical protein